MNNKLDKMITDLYSDIWGSTGKEGSESENPVDGFDSEEIKRINREIMEEIKKDFGYDLRNLEYGKNTKEQIGDTGSQEKTAGEETTGAREKSIEEIAAEAQPNPMDELNALIGLTELKDDVKELINLVKIQKMRQEKGLKVVPVSLHLVFTGNPGTGKTTIARILASLYKEIGVLSKGQLVEVDRSALVAGYVGQTAIKTQEKVQEAMGGVLFIDEAYTLATESGNDFGQEAIDTILKAMEDHRDDLVVIVAGYPDLMKNFINSNPGLKSRFNKYIYFPDYNVQELTAIFRSLCEKYDYKLDEEAEKLVEERIQKLECEKDENFANARSVRNLFENIITNQATRVAGLEAPTDEDMITIRTEDVD